MLETLKALILDAQEAPLETGVPRRLSLAAVPGKASVCVGVRRSGKSTYLFQIMQRLLAGNIPRQNILYLNFFDDRLHGLQGHELGLVLEAYHSLYPQKINTETVFCFFDEIQAVPGWESFVDRLLRTEKCEVYLTGSSSRMLSKEIATQMRGRALSWELFPFSFREYLAYRKIEADGELSTKRRLLVQSAFDDYWETGGFPETVGLNRRLRVMTHQEYFHAVLFRDLIERHDAAHPKAVCDLAHRLIADIASFHTVNRLTNGLKALGHKVPKSAVTEYLSWFEDAYFLFSVRLFDASLARSLVNPKKIYCVDHALVNSVSSGILNNTGHLLENLVYLGLRRIRREVFYYKTKTGREVDFILSPNKRPRTLIQVCETLAEPRTKQREIAALAEAMSEQGVRTGTIVTRAENSHINVENGTISIIPIWRFLLNLPDLQEEGNEG
jgi:hypothetical protein